MQRLLSLIVIALGIGSQQTWAQEHPTVILPGTDTVVSGEYLPFVEDEFLNVDTTFEEFLGIPFAEPPVDDLRFKKPLKKGYLGTSYMATADQSQCPQGNDDNPNEDCLYLGVFTSSPRPENAAVMVYIHGGGYTGGAGSDSTYKPYSLLALSPDMVVVTINYRLGVLGFLTTGDSASPGNYGMFDQVMALEWVRDNIAAFGGNPNKVTIMGESAGAASVGIHLLSPLSGGLFHQAIMESGNAVVPWAVDTNIDRQIGFTKDVAEFVNCTTSSNAAMMQCLSTTDAADLLDAQLYTTATNLVIELVFVPIVDNDLLTDMPHKLVERGEFHSVPTLLGTNLDEGTLIVFRAYPDYILQPFTLPHMSLEYFREILPDYLYYSSPLLVSAVEQWYVDWTQADNSSANQIEQFIQMQTDQVFACGTEAMARAMEATQAPVYRYEFTHHDGNAWYGAGHAVELQYVFGVGVNPYSNSLQSDEEKWMSVEFMRHWTNFIKTSNPNEPMKNSEYPDWPRYTLPDQEYKVLSLPMENKRALRMDTCAFWLNYAPTLYQSDNPDELFQDWQQEYEEWRDVHMTEWEAEFEKYQNEGGCA